MVSTSATIAIQKSRTYGTLVLICISTVLHKLGLRTYDYCIDIPTEAKIYDTLVLTSVSIFPEQLGLTIHWI